MRHAPYRLAQRYAIRFGSSMHPHRAHAPTPDLRIVSTGSLMAHEDHDSQRSQPLIARLQAEEFVINPPVVAPMDADQFVILDGANRCHAFAVLNYPHVLVQVAPYESGFVELQTWNHVVTDWTEEAFLQYVSGLVGVQTLPGHHSEAVAHITLTNGHTLALIPNGSTVHERSAALRQFVSVYQQHARLHRTSLSSPTEIWSLYERSVAFIQFPPYQPADIITAARQQALLPPGVSRHIVYGRALRVNYPLAYLRDEHTALANKNEALQRWLRAKLANRQIRYYAEPTYQFDE